jgi:hypothetical protein
MLNIIDNLTTFIDICIKVNFPRDYQYAKFNTFAISASTDFQITGDRDVTEI